MRKRRSKKTATYLISHPHGLVKVGVTTDIKARMRSLSRLSAKPLTLQYTIWLQRDDALNLEKMTHNALSSHRLFGEWFQVSVAFARDVICDLASANGLVTCEAPRSTLPDTPVAEHAGFCDYPIQVKPDDAGYLVTCPDLPEVTTDADTITDAPVRAADAIEEALAGRLEDFGSIPYPSDGDLRCGPISSSLALKVALKWKIEDQGVNRAELARILNWNRNSVDRLFHPRHGTKIDQFDAAFRAVGAFPVFKVREL